MILWCTDCLGDQKPLFLKAISTVLLNFWLIDFLKQWTPLFFVVLFSDEESAILIFVSFLVYSVPFLGSCVWFRIQKVW